MTRDLAKVFGSQGWILAIRKAPRGASGVDAIQRGDLAAAYRHHVLTPIGKLTAAER